MKQHTPPTPYFLSYPVPGTPEKNDHGRRDLEYFRQMYSAKARHCLKAVMDILDRVDYRGSFIYDEFPDRVGLLRLLEMVIQEMRRREREMMPVQYHFEEKDRELLEILMLYEIYRRRQEN